MIDFITTGYFGLFAIAFLAATILPLSSELALLGLISTGLPAPALIIVATIGNTLGSLTNYGLGYWARFDLITQWLKVSETTLRKAEARFKKIGIASLCFAWLPIIGDPLTIIAGVLRVRLAWVILLVTTGKALRYCVVAALANG